MTDSLSSRSPRRYIYHFTHVDNVAAIFASGFLHCDSRARSGMTRAEVGDPDIKESRRRRSIPIGPGGQVGEYVPFYFAPRSPMMYRIACDHRDAVPDRYQHGDRPLVYLVSTTELVIGSGARWVATDGNAATATTEFTDREERLPALIDWPLMEAERWNNTYEDMDRQRRRMAEFLVHERVPTTLIGWVAAFDDRHAAEVRDVLSDHRVRARIIVRPRWYYGYERG